MHVHMCSGTTDHGLGRLSSSPRTKTNRSRGKRLLALGGYGSPLWSMMLMHRASATGCKQHRTCALSPLHCATMCCRQHAGISQTLKENTRITWRGGVIVFITWRDETPLTKTIQTQGLVALSHSKTPGWKLSSAADKACFRKQRAEWWYL